MQGQLFFLSRLGLRPVPDCWQVAGTGRLGFDVGFRQPVSLLPARLPHCCRHSPHKRHFLGNFRLGRAMQNREEDDGERPCHDDVAPQPFATRRYPMVVAGCRCAQPHQTAGVGVVGNLVPPPPRRPIPGPVTSCLPAVW